MKKTVEIKSLVGRQVYFKLSKKLAKRLSYFTPNKLYTIHISRSNLHTVTADNGEEASIILKGCAHLSLYANWILKRKTK